MIKTILLNGLAGTGKDYLADLASIKFQFSRHAFKEPVIDGVLDEWHISHSEFDARYTRELKDIPWVRFGGRTPREVLIEYAEYKAKPKYGNGVFAEYIANCLENGLNIITDLGFIDELKPIMEWSDEILVVIIEAPPNGLSCGRTNMEEHCKSLNIPHKVIYNDLNSMKAPNEFIEIIEKFVENT